MTALSVTPVMAGMYMEAGTGAFSGNSALYGSFTGNAGIGYQSTGIAGGIKVFYVTQATKYPDYGMGTVSMMPIMATVTARPNRGRWLPWAGFGIGYVMTERNLNDTSVVYGWKVTEEAENGMAYMAGGGLEYRASKTVSLEFGVNQIFFSTRFKNTRKNKETFREEGSTFTRFENVNLDGIVGTLSVRVRL